MKATGIVRRIDDLGRVVIPKEIRRTLGLAETDPVEFYVNGESIILRKYVPGCILCDNADDLQEYRGKKLCGKCIEEIANK